MKVIIIMFSVMLFGLVGVATSEAFGKCIYDPSFPNAPCNDEIILEIMPQPKTHIENIDGELFLVSESFSKEPESEKIVRIKDVSFTPPSYPVPTPPGGVVFTKITFSDGVKESLSKVGSPLPFTVFTEHKNPQAGFRGNPDGTFSFLVSMEKQDISPLKQLYSAISPDEVICKAGLVLVQKHTGLAACVTSETREKLIQRDWAVDFPMKYIIDERYWSKTYLVHHTMCAHIGVWEQSKEKMKDRPVWEMTDADLEKIPIIKSMIEYNSRGLYSSSEYSITSTVVSDEIQNQYRHAFNEIANSKSDTNSSAFWYNGKYYDVNFLIC